MARHKHEAETETSSAPEAPSKGSITIQGIEFEYAAPYHIGYALRTEGEVNQFNGVRGENLRNNFASKVKAALTKTAEERGEGAELTEGELEALRSEFASYDSQYEFAGKRISRGPQGPVRSKAKSMARETIGAALKGKGIKVSDLAEGKMDELIEKYLEAHPEVVEQAKEQVERTKAAASAALEGVDLEAMRGQE